jgi:hypothetical protein
MKKLIGFLIFYLLVPFVTSHAQDICVKSSLPVPFFFRFENVKLGKKPFAGKFFHGNSNNCGGQFSSPVMGVANKQGTSVRIGVTVFMAGCPDSSTLIWTMVGDETFSSTGDLDRGANGLGTADASDTWTAINCNEIPFPNQ